MVIARLSKKTQGPRRPETKLTMIRITAMTRSRWINPPRDMADKTEQPKDNKYNRDGIEHKDFVWI